MKRELVRVKPTKRHTKHGIVHVKGYTKMVPIHHIKRRM